MSDILSIPTWEAVGLDASKGTPAYIGQTYYATDTGISYLATGTATSDDWKVRAILPTVKGDLFVATGAGVIAKFPAGTDGQIIVADSTEPSGLKFVGVASATGKKYAHVSGNGLDPTTTIVAGLSTGYMSWATENADNDAMVDLGSNNDRITIKTAGFYRVETWFRVRVPTSGAGDMVAQFRNDTTGFGPTFIIESSTSLALHDTLIHLVAYDTFAINDPIRLYFDLSACSADFSVAGLGQADFWMAVTEQ